MRRIGNSIELLLDTMVAGILVVFLFAGWGSTGHRIINTYGGLNLPAEMAGFIQRASVLAAHASDADSRKSSDPTEGAKHFIDIDDYPEFATRTLTHSLDSLILEYGVSRVNTNGVNPWATTTTMDSLTAQMRRADWTKAWLTAADLGHYVGDAHQPLHCTANYDGQKTGNRGIHSRYESNMVDQYQQWILNATSQPNYIVRPIDFVFEYTYQSSTYVDSIMAADTYAKQSSGWNGSGQEPAAYYPALWSKAGPFTMLQFQRAVDAFVSLLYTCWVNAGRPAIPVVLDVSTTSQPAGDFVLHDAYPNPFNPTTTIDYELPVAASVSLRVFNSVGQVVGSLVEEKKEAGTYRVDWSPQLPSGIYFYVMQARTISAGKGGAGRTGPAREFVQTKRMVLLK